MKHLGLLIILAAPLLFGQMCGTTEPAENDPVQQVLGSGLTPGLYAGQSETWGKTTYYGPYAPAPREFNSGMLPTSVTVAASGVPTDSKGRELTIGLTDGFVAGDISFQLTVTGLTVDANKVSVNYDVRMDLTLPDETVIPLTGIGSDLYIQSGTQITDAFQAFVSGSHGELVATMELQSMSTVTR